MPRSAGVILAAALLAIAATRSSGQTTPATSRPAARALSPAEVLDLHRQAVALIRQGQLDKAAPLLGRVYDLTPPAKRDRALVLNRAMLELMQRKLVMRALRELQTYLNANRAEDEFATNILGAALDVAARDIVNAKANPIWRDAYKEWERRDFNLSHSRAGWNRWGADWVSAEQHDAIMQKRDRAHEAVVEQQKVVRDALEKFQLLLAQQSNAAVMRRTYADLLQQFINSTLIEMRRGDSAAYMSELRDPRWEEDAKRISVEIEKLTFEVQGAWRTLGSERERMSRLLAQMPVPAWPTKFEPLDPGAAPSATQPAAPAAQPATRTPAAQPATRTSAAQPATRASVEEMTKGIEFMRQKKHDKALPLLNQAYESTPVDQLPRPLVLNRAIVDLAHRQR